MNIIRLSEIRKQRNITQEELARWLKISRSTYASYETNRRQMNYETLCLLADYFGVSADYLLGRQDAVPSFLDEEERTLIEQYRMLDRQAKDTVQNSLSFEYTHATRQK